MKFRKRHNLKEKFQLESYTTILAVLDLGDRIEAPKAPMRRWGWGVGRPHPNWGRGLERGKCPLPRKFFSF